MHRLWLHFLKFVKESLGTSLIVHLTFVVPAVRVSTNHYRCYHEKRVQQKEVRVVGLRKFLGSSTIGITQGNIWINLTRSRCTAFRCSSNCNILLTFVISFTWSFFINVSFQSNICFYINDWHGYWSNNNIVLSLHKLKIIHIIGGIWLFYHCL